MSKTESNDSSRYPYRQTISTRWKDNDIYGHVNNIDYYGFFDTIINTYLIRHGGLDIHEGQVIGFCAESHCRFLHAFAFPDDVEAGLRVARIGNSSVRYELALFRVGETKPSATGWFVHVFVDRHTRRPQPLPTALRSALEAIATEETS